MSIGLFLMADTKLVERWRHFTSDLDDSKSKNVTLTIGILAAWFVVMRVVVAVGKGVGVGVSVAVGRLVAVGDTVGIGVGGCNVGVGDGDSTKGGVSTTQRNPLSTKRSSGSSLLRRAARMSLSTLAKPPPRTALCVVPKLSLSYVVPGYPSYQSLTLSHTFPAMSKAPTQLAPPGYATPLPK